MRFASTILTGVAAAALASCEPSTGNNATSAAPQSEAARNAAGDKTIVDALGTDDSKFADAAKATGLDATLAGPGPYTVLVPTNAAFDKLPAGTLDTLMKPQSRARLTRVLTAHILPGAILAEDITRAIDKGKGKATLATFGGDTLTATRDGARIILTDHAGAKAVIDASDDKRSNGVVHHVDTVLAPAG